MSREALGINFEAAHNETRLGHIRRFSAEDYAGSVIFEFDGDRDDRHFYLVLERKDGQGSETAFVGADTADELVEIMHDDQALTWVIEHAEYNPDARSVAA